MPVTLRSAAKAMSASAEPPRPADASGGLEIPEGEVPFHFYPHFCELLRSEDVAASKARVHPGPGDQFDEVLDLRFGKRDRLGKLEDYVIRAQIQAEEYHFKVGDGALEKLDDDLVFPRYDESQGLVIAHDELYKEAVYIKRLCPMFLEVKKSAAAVNFAYEAGVLNELSKQPHPHIVRYFGCRLRRGHITGLVFERLPRSLVELTETELKCLDKDRFLKQLRSAVAFIHARGYVHGDIKPDNIMVRDGQQPVLIDFGTCKPAGWMCMEGTPEWSNGIPEYAARENDLYSLRLLEERFDDYEKLHDPFGCSP